MKQIILITILLFPVIASAQYNYYTKPQSDANDLKVLDTAQKHIDTVSQNIRAYLLNVLMPYATKNYVDSEVGVTVGPIYGQIGTINGNISALQGQLNGKLDKTDTMYLLRKTTAAILYQPLLGYTPYNATNPNNYISTYTETDPLSFHNSDTAAKFAALRALIPTTTSQLTNNSGYTTGSALQAVKTYDSTQIIDTAAVIRAGIINYAAGYGLTLTGSTFKADSSLLATRLRLQKVVDSLSGIIALKQAQLNGTGFVKQSGATTTYDNSTYYKSGDSAVFRAEQITGPLAVNSTIAPGYALDVTTKGTDVYAARYQSVGDIARAGTAQYVYRTTPGGVAYSLIDGYVGLSGSTAAQVVSFGVYAAANTPSSVYYGYWGAGTDNDYINNAYRTYPGRKAVMPGNASSGYSSDAAVNTSTRWTVAGSNTSNGTLAEDIQDGNGTSLWAVTNAGNATLKKGNLMVTGTSSTTGQPLVVYNSSGTTEFQVNSAGGIQTAPPSGGTSVPIQFGEVVTGSGGTNKYWRTSINGVTVFIPIFVQSTVPN